MWRQPSKTNAQMHADLADCRTRAAQNMPVGTANNVSSRISSHYANEDFLRDCMIGKGYEWQRPKLASPATH
jgi:hypothetical protein